MSRRNRKKQNKKENDDEILEEYKQRAQEDLANAQNDEEEDSFEDDDDEDGIDCCDRCLFSLFGYACIFISIFVIIFSERDYKYSQQDLSFMQEHLKSIDISKKQVNNSKSKIESHLSEISNSHFPIHLINDISLSEASEMIVHDDRSDLSYPGLALKIRTEMYQWIEREEVIRKEGTTKTETIYLYSQEWSSNFHDSSNFNEQDEHYNPQPTVSQLSIRNVWVDDIQIGSPKNSIIQLHLDKSLFPLLSKNRQYWTNVTEKVFEYSELENWEMNSGYLFRPYDKAASYYNDDIDDEDADDGASDDDDIMKERERLEVARTMVGDIRMSIFVLDSRGKEVTFVGSVFKNEENDYNQFTLIPWKSVTNRNFELLQYGNVNIDDCIRVFEEGNITKLYISRFMTFMMILVGFLILNQLLNKLIGKLYLNYIIRGIELPLIGFVKIFIASLVVSIILWIFIFGLAWVIPDIRMVLVIVTIIDFLLFWLNTPIKNKNDKDEDEDDKEKTKKNE